MKVVLIGTGNVATILGKQIVLAGHEMVQVYGRNEPDARQLAAILSSTFTSKLEAITNDADIYILAVSDGAIPELAARLKLGKKLVVHTAGSVSKNVLAVCSTNYGILYPLQSLRKEMQLIPKIPLLVDGNTGEDLTLIYDFAESVTGIVQKTTDEQRLKLHVAAVIVSNFTNHLYAMAEQYCVMEKVDFHLLLPLIESIAGRLNYFNPADVQTGPAIRNDTSTINKHLDILSDHPQLADLYRWFTKSIQESRK